MLRREHKVKRSTKLQILLADDHEVVRRGARTLIEQHPDWEVCGEAGDGASAVSLAEQLRPDIAVLDLGMPKMGGLEATRRIKRLLPSCEVIVFTGEEDEKLVHEVFAAGARSYILKRDIGRHFIAAIEALGQHKTYFTSKISDLVFARYLESNKVNGESELTSREREIVQLLAEGKSNKQVASSLNISSKTVETHRAAVMRKLELESFADLVRYAVRQGIVEA